MRGTVKSLNLSGGKVVQGSFQCLSYYRVVRTIDKCLLTKINPKPRRVACFSHASSPADLSSGLAAQLFQ